MSGNGKQELRGATLGATALAALGLGLFGAALLYGDGVITPAISVLSAIEGLKVATPVFAPYVVPITLVLLAGLFAGRCSSGRRRPPPSRSSGWCRAGRSTRSSCSRRWPPSSPRRR